MSIQPENSQYLSSNNRNVIADSGTTCHVAGNKEWFSKIHKLTHPIGLTTASGRERITESGTIAGLARIVTLRRK